MCSTNLNQLQVYWTFFVFNNDVCGMNFEMLDLNQNDYGIYSCQITALDFECQMSFLLNCSLVLY